MPATPRPRPSRFWAWTAAYWFKIIEAAIMCVTALLIGLFVARPLINRMFAPNAAGAAAVQLANASPVAGALPAPARSAGARRHRRRRPPAALPAPSPASIISRIEGQVREFLHQENR